MAQDWKLLSILPTKFIPDNSADSCADIHTVVSFLLCEEHGFLSTFMTCCEDGTSVCLSGVLYIFPWIRSSWDLLVLFFHNPAFLFYLFPFWSAPWCLLAPCCSFLMLFEWLSLNCSMQLLHSFFDFSSCWQVAAQVYSFNVCLFLSFFLHCETFLILCYLVSSLNCRVFSPFIPCFHSFFPRIQCWSLLLKSFPIFCFLCF